jgi:hypothetical protein
MVWTGSNWLRIGTSGGLLRTRWWTFGFLKISRYFLNGCTIGSFSGRTQLRKYTSYLDSNLLSASETCDLMVPVDVDVLRARMHMFWHSVEGRRLLTEELWAERFVPWVSSKIVFSWAGSVSGSAEERTVSSGREREREKWQSSERHYIYLRKKERKKEPIY